MLLLRQAFPPEKLLLLLACTCPYPADLAISHMSWLHRDVCLSADLLPDQGQVQLGRQVVIWNLKVEVRWVSLKTQWFASVQRNNELEWKPTRIVYYGSVDRMGPRRMSVQSLASGWVEVAGSHHFSICLAPAASIFTQSAHLSPARCWTEFPTPDSSGFSLRSSDSHAMVF